MIRRVEFGELEHIYNERIVVDFPPMERRPLSLIRKLMRRGKYVCLVLEDKASWVSFYQWLKGRVWRV